MKWPGTSFVLLTVVFGILLFDIEFANGILCYICDPCESGKLSGRTCGAHQVPDPGSRSSVLNLSLELGTERTFGDPPGFGDPPPGFGNPPPGFRNQPPPGFIFVKSDRCLKAEYEDGTVKRYCSYKAQEGDYKKLGYKCNEIAKDTEFKVCICSTDLCNGAPKVIGNSKPLAILSVITFVFTYSIVNLF